MKVVYNSKEIGDNYNNYNRLVNKPLINSVELVGNITLNDINVYTKDEVKRLISSARSVKTGINLPSPLTPNTTYYIGPNEHNIYTVYLTDSSDPINAFVIGTTSFGKYYSGEGIDVTDDTNIVSVLVDSESVIINSEGLLEARPVFEKMVPFNGATASKDGSKGLVPKPEAGDQDKFLFGDCTWKSILDLIYPIGSLFIAYTSSTDPNTTLGGTWEKLTSQRTLWSSDNGGSSTASSSLPDIRGTMALVPVSRYSSHIARSGAFTFGRGWDNISGFEWNGMFVSLGQEVIRFKASDYNATYNNSINYVRPMGTNVVVWRRVA